MLSFPSAAFVVTAALGWQADTPIVKPTLDAAAVDLAADIRKLVMTNPAAQGSVRLGAFEGPPGNGSGAKLAKLLEESFAKDNVKVVNTGGFRVGGNVEITSVDGKLVMVVECEVFNSAGRRVQTLVKRIVMDRDSALAASGVTADLSAAAATRSIGDPSVATTSPPATTPPVVTPPVAQPPVAQPPLATPPVANPPPATAGVRPQTEVALPKTDATQAVLTALERPTAEIQKQTVAVKQPNGAVQAVVQQVVKASAESPYGIEILRGPKRDAFAAAEVSLEQAPGGSVSFVQLTAADVFAIRVHNASRRPVGCMLTIDGINVFAFSEIPAWRQLGKMVIGPGSGLVGGWHKTDDISLEFVITKYADSAAAKLGVDKGVGTITAVFFETFDPNDPAARGDAPAEGVGIGQAVKVPYKPVVVRFGDPVAVVTVRYNRPDLPSGPAANAPVGGPPVTPAPAGTPAVPSNPGVTPPQGATPPPAPPQPTLPPANPAAVPPPAPPAPAGGAVPPVAPPPPAPPR